MNTKFIFKKVTYIIKISTILSNSVLGKYFSLPNFTYLVIDKALVIL